ncbi:MAG: DUF2202 domain-containing protein [Paludibacter sp.]|nr:DUF2202 domain-containing protein [Paludibacter sp.]
MKSTKLFLATLLIAASFQLTSCNQVEASTEELVDTSSLVESTAMEVGSFITNPDSVISSDIDGLMLMREEEKMAHDVYVYFYDQYQYRIFDNISKSESRHTESVLNLITYFVYSDPATGIYGQFNNVDIQAIFNELTTEATTLEQALATGAYIEEYDIADLKTEISKTENADIIKVYTNLKRASGYHLKAFVKTLAMQGVTYKPQILSQEEYDILVQ